MMHKAFDGIDGQSGVLKKRACLISAYKAWSAIAGSLPYGAEKGRKSFGVQKGNVDAEVMVSRNYVLV